MRPLALVLLLAGALAVPGCLFDGCDVDGGWDPELWEPDASPWWGGVDGGVDTNLAPTFAAIEVPGYPPLGPDGGVTVTLEDDVGLASLQYEFEKVNNAWINGKAATLFLPATILGDGYGDLQLTVYDVRGAWTRKVVENLVVDLEPPQIDVMPPRTARPGDDLITWVSDGWLLGSVELTIGEATQREEFPPVYPSYFGEQWDVSYVRFSAPAFADGSYPARLTVKDAAGNQVTQPFTLTIDGSVPTLSVLSPAAGATVSGRFTVEVEADDGGQPVIIVVRLDGVEIAAAAGPAASIALDAADFAPGALDLEVEARDAVGNTASLSLPLTVAP